MSERMKWISPKNTSQIQWALSYLKEKSGNPGFWHTRYIGETAYQQLIKWDQGQIESAEYREFLRRMRGAWAQKKHRGKNKDKRAYSIVLPVKTKQQLDRISKELSLSLAETVEKLIQSSKEQQESFFDNERPKLHQKRADDSIRRDANDYRENSEIFSELLTFSLIDISILKIRNSAQLDSETEISEIERLSTNLLEEFLKEGNEGLKRRMSNITLNNQAIPPKRTLIEKRLKNLVQTTNQTPIALKTEINPNPLLPHKFNQALQHPNFNSDKLNESLEKMSRAFTDQD